jgi:hypothetical protein
MTTDREEWKNKTCCADHKLIKTRAGEYKNDCVSPMSRQRHSGICPNLQFSKKNEGK